MVCLTNVVISLDAFVAEFEFSYSGFETRFARFAFFSTVDALSLFSATLDKSIFCTMFSANLEEGACSFLFTKRLDVDVDDVTIKENNNKLDSNQI